MTKHNINIIQSKTDKNDTQVDLQVQHVSVIEQEKEPFATSGTASDPIQQKRGQRSFSMRSLVRAGLARLQDSQPERLSPQDGDVAKLGSGLGAFPQLVLIQALGLLAVSLSYYIACLNYNEPEFEALFITGLLLLFVPPLVRLLSPAPTRLERLSLLCVLGLSLYLIQFMVSPLGFVSYDEILHWRTADDILRTGHLFADNPMLTVGPYYCGIELVTNAISTISGLSTFQSAALVICAARFIMVLSLFLLYEQITESSRMAGIVTIIYMANPHFLFFDTMFSYETLALPLATFLFYLLARYETIRARSPRVIGVAWLVVVAVTLTHHMTNYVFDGLLLLWAGISLLRASSGTMRIHLTAIALFGVLLSLAYTFLLPGNPASAYLSSYFSTAFVDLGHIFAGTGTARPLFVTNQAVPPTPIWDRLLMAGSVALVMLALPLGLFTLWSCYRHQPLVLTLGLFSLGYPISQLFRFTNFGAEITDRASAFFFLPIAYLLTIFIAHFWPVRTLNRKTTAFITCGLSVVFLGGVVLGVGPSWTNVPGPYVVTADGRSIEREGIQAASWFLPHLGPANRIGTDRINNLLLLSYGDQRIVTGLDDKVDVAAVFYSSSLGPKELAILRQAKIRYLVVDQRLSTSLPLLGFYFEEGEAGSFQLKHPISKANLTKFNAVPQVKRVFDSGNIVVYDVEALARSGS